MDVVSEPLPERSMKEVSGGVVALGRVSCHAVDPSQDTLSRPEVPLFGHDGEDLVLADPQDILYTRATTARIALDVARVGDLSAPRRVERGLDELDEQALAVERDRADAGLRRSRS